MATAGSIVVDLLMRTGSFETDTNRASKQMKKLGKDSTDAAADIGKAFGKIAGTAVGGLAVAGTAVLNWTRQLVDASAELEKFSRLSGTNEQVFQRMAAGAATVGIQQDKLADIFKDTQDKLGDFLSTGGGAMKDFFEQIAPRVNLTADAFRNLSGPEVLQKYYKALEDAGASQADMVFYMEAIASDSSLLAPLLARNGDGFRKWGDEAQRLGAVLDADTLASMTAVKEQSNQIQLAFQGLKNEVAAELLPQFKELTAFLGSDQTKSAFTSVTRWVGDLVAEMANGAVLIVNFIDKVRQLRNLDAGGSVGATGDAALNDRLANLNDQIANAKRLADAAPFESTRQANLQILEGYRKQRKEIIEELKRRSGPQVTLIDDGQMLPESALKPVASKAGTFRAKSVDKEAETSAKKLSDAIKSANDQLKRQIALFGDSSELSRVNYEIQSGGLKGIDSAAQAALRSSASLLDMLGNIDEAESIMGESAQKFADAFDGMFGIDDDSSSVVEDRFKQWSAYADQAARNMQDAFADFLFDPFSDGLGGMVQGFAKALQKMAAQAAASQIFQMIGNWANSYSGAGSSWINAIGSAIGGSAGGRAGGGPVAGGSMYRVGEGGRPELFDQGGKTYLIPGDAGSVRPITAGLPASSMGAGGGINNNFSTTLNVTTDGTSNTQQGSGSEQGRQVQQAFNQMINQWAVQQSRPGGLFHQMSTRNG
ncbi:hypothetical protein [Stenotrophomonas maltophilia]|uniref:hypothetical protein n=1 Tax=Stenotrophomonas maltophilia TaxID=40324 RepID=UPI00066B1397|nr:hypothetical protein [Stenotrophomonas maltophilia]